MGLETSGILWCRAVTETQILHWPRGMRWPRVKSSKLYLDVPWGSGHREVAYKADIQSNHLRNWEEVRARNCAKDEKVQRILKIDAETMNTITRL